ncbi:hypothetical protein WAI453_009449 [Rhynchosporium graminicola]|uniref:Uncharacterized protein n=1 Tax=Rhynchosporium graminicola TaxID=2792576 RepID=A0A1E1KSF7_9HELO|nr:uncharacterized protein RCO7_02849 [Rhynchosporium commune]
MSTFDAHQIDGQAQASTESTTPDTHSPAKNIDATTPPSSAYWLTCLKNEWLKIQEKEKDSPHKFELHTSLKDPIKIFSKPWTLASYWNSFACSDTRVFWWIEHIRSYNTG